MKIGIVTITWGTNYGNRLQNYAVQTVLERLGCEVETFHREGDTPHDIKLIIKKIVSYLYTKQNGYSNWRLNIWGREVKYENFNNRFIHFSNVKLISKKVDANLNDQYDYFICGSDQIWNPDYMGCDDIAFLDFAEKEKSIAYCPSIGLSNLPDKYKADFTEWLNNISALSVREEKGAEIICDLTGISPRVLLDPTLMLTKEDWMKIESKPQNIKAEKYIFLYFLGKGKRERKVQEFIKRIAEEQQLEIVDVFDIGQKNSFVLSPSEFVYLINHCTLVCTDSYHGSIFSYLFNKPFVVFDRVDRNKPVHSRLDTLLETLNLTDRKFSSLKEDNIFVYDYSDSSGILQRKREETIQYLKEALHISKEKAGNCETL